MKKRKEKQHTEKGREWKGKSRERRNELLELEVRVGDVANSGVAGMWGTRMRHSSILQWLQQCISNSSHLIKLNLIRSQSIKIKRIPPFAPIPPQPSSTSHSSCPYNHPPHMAP